MNYDIINKLMISNELVTREDEAERLFRIGADAINLTVIFNAHGDAADAERSVECIESDSVVFLEGFTVAEGAERDYENGLSMLNRCRITEGKNGEMYQAVKTFILRDIEDCSDYVPKGPDDFTINSLRRLSLLIEKDCLILYADHQDLSQSLSETYNREFRENAKHIATVHMPDLKPGDGVGRAINTLRRGVMSEATAHKLRETSAATHLLLDSARLDSSDSAKTTRRDGAGKMVAYLMYGTAHARSLTAELQEYGVDPKVVQPNPIAEYRYLDILLPSYENYGRRLGHTALESLSYDFMEPDVAQSIVDTAYKYLEFLNTIDNESLRSFIVTCMLAKREEETDFDAAFKQYFSILRSFMPNPQDFVA